jgi:hypothetical protein
VITGATTRIGDELVRCGENGFELVIDADEAKFRRRLNVCAAGVNVESVEKPNPKEETSLAHRQFPRLFNN